MEVFHSILTAFTAEQIYLSKLTTIVLTAYSIELSPRIINVIVCTLKEIVISVSLMGNGV
jgi:hypothetical protein